MKSSSRFFITKRFWQAADNNFFLPSSDPSCNGIVGIIQMHICMRDLPAHSYDSCWWRLVFTAMNVRGCWSAVSVTAGAHTLLSPRRWNMACTIKVDQDYLVFLICHSCCFQLTEALQVQTPPVPPGPCQPPRVVGKPKAREVQIRWGKLCLCVCGY